MSKDLIRIEHKIDLIIFALQQAGIMQNDLPSLIGIEEDICAVCKEYIRITVDPEKGKLNRLCACRLPKQAFKLQLVTPSNEENKNANNRDTEIQIPPNQPE